MGIFTRSEKPLLTKADIDLSASGIPGVEDVEVIAVCNAAVADLRLSGQDDKIVLMARVIIRLKEKPEDRTGKIPFCYWQNETIRISYGRYQRPKDPGSLILDQSGRKHQDHTSFMAKIVCPPDFSQVEIEPIGLLPRTQDETSGIEDGRAVWFEGEWHLVYTAVSPTHGICVADATTQDWRTFNRHNLIFADPNKDASLFPDRVDNEAVWGHRPSGEHSRPSIWLAFGHEPWRPSGPYLFVAPRPGIDWEQQRIGMSGPPFTADGIPGEFVIPYHGRSKRGRYSQGFILAQLKAGQRRIIAQSREPAMTIELFKDVDGRGLAPGAIFSCGQVVEPKTNRFTMVVSRADTDLWLAETTIPQIFEHLSYN